MNKVILIGRVGQEPEVRYMPNGKAVANLSLATTKKWKDKSSGERKEATEWHRCVFYEKLAEIVGEYVKKGHLISVEGENRTRKWTDKAGTDRYTTEVVVGMDGSMEMLTAKTHDQQQQASSPSAHHSAAQGSNQGYHTGTAEGFNDDDFFDDDVAY